MTKKTIAFYIDEKICYVCHSLNPLHSCLFKKIKKLNKKTDKKKITTLLHLLYTYDCVYHKAIHPILKILHKKLKVHI